MSVIPERLLPMIGLACSEATIGYGGILRLGFGELVRYDHPKLKECFHGLWELSTSSGVWRIYVGNKVVAGHYDDEPVQQAALQGLLGRVLEAVNPYGTDCDVAIHLLGGATVEFLGISANHEGWTVRGPGLFMQGGPGPALKDDPGTTPMTEEEQQFDVHTLACANRWTPTLPRQIDHGCCIDCAYYMHLRGQFYFWDFGLCSNGQSSHDGRVTSVKSGCEHFALRLESE